MTQPAPRTRIFISASPADNEFACRLADDLRKLGLDVWFHPDSIQPAEAWRDQIIRQIADSSIFILVLSPDAVNSRQVHEEFELARREGTGVTGIIVVLASPVGPADIPVTWDIYPRYDATHDYAGALAALTRTLGLSPSASLAPPATRAAPPSPAPPIPPAGQGYGEYPAPQTVSPAPSQRSRDESPSRPLVPRAPVPTGAAPGQARGGRREEGGRRDAKADVSARTLQFSAFHPNEIATGAWSTLLVYAYVAEALSQIQADAATFTELGSAPQEARGQSTRRVRQGVELTIEPHMDGVTFSPASDTFVWRGDWRRSLFRLMADARLDGTTQKGWIDIYAGRMSPIASIDVSFSFHRAIPKTALSASGGMAVTANAFDTVFISYSHRDEEAMRQARTVYEQLGIAVLVDELLQSGDNFDHRLMDMIQAANVFHLLWSRHSAASDYVRKEWTSALASGKGERFIRPWYWRKPLAPPPSEMEARKVSFKYERLKRRFLKPSTWL